MDNAAACWTGGAYGQTLVIVSVAGRGGHVAPAVIGVQVAMVMVPVVVEVKVIVPEVLTSVGKNVLQLAVFAPVNVPIMPSHHAWVKSISITIA